MMILSPPLIFITAATPVYPFGLFTEMVTFLFSAGSIVTVFVVLEPANELI